ncbi:putative integral membrane protein [Diaporthe ampelina]|uniref:Putative integral membrane protein n=1 Tax=Diaporthe ampelina TaxID=1214573 RepID=A0A0G2FSJ8_9PEZI|nr:putative integral membrane protein [Diaporthe ampelina]
MDPQRARPNDDGFGAYINVIGWLLLSLAGLVVSARIWAKISARKGLWWDDYIVLAAWIMLLADVIVTTVAVDAGLGKHIDSVTGDTLIRTMLLGAVAQMLSILGATWSKTSFAVTLLRLTVVSHVRYLVWFIIVSLNVFSTFTAFLPLFQCTPIGRSFNPTVEGTCWDRTLVLVLTIFGAAYSAAADFALAIIPWVLIWNLQMNLKEKIGVGICMSLGIVAGATSIMRCLKIPLLLTDDFTFESGQLSIWSAAEIATTIMATSIPVLRLWLKTIVSVHSRYHLSSADGTFDGRGVLQQGKQPLHQQHSKMTTMATTTTITSAGNSSMVRKASSKRGRAVKLADLGWASRSSSESEDIEGFGSPVDRIPGGAAGGIVKMDTITVNYDKRTASMMG